MCLIEAIVALEYSCKAIAIEEALRSGQPEGGAFFGIRRERRYRKVPRRRDLFFRFSAATKVLETGVAITQRAGDALMQLCNLSQFP